MTDHVSSRNAAKALLIREGDSVFAGLVMQSLDYWRADSPGESLASSLVQAIGAGLMQMTTINMETLAGMAEEPALGWRAFGRPSSGRLSIRDGQGWFKVADLGIQDPPDDWWRVAEGMGLLLLMVTPERPDTQSSSIGDALIRMAAQGILYAAVVIFSANEPPPDPLPVDHVSRSGVDPARALLKLAEDARDRILAMPEARSRARRLGHVLSCGPLAGLYQENELIDVLIPAGNRSPDIVGVIGVYALLAVEFAEACDLPRSSQLWRKAADYAVAAGAQLLSVERDPEIFAEVTRISELRLAGTSGATIGEIIEALESAVRLRLAASGPQYSGGDYYAIYEGLITCATAAAATSSTISEARMPDPDQCLHQAGELLHKLLDLSVSALNISAETFGFQIESMLQDYDPDGQEADLIRQAAEAGLSRTDPERDPALWIFFARVLCQFDATTETGGSAVARHQAIELIAGVFTWPAIQFRDRYGALTTWQVISQAIIAALWKRSRPLLDQAVAWADALPPAEAAANRRQLWEARGHCLPQDPTVCPVPNADLSGLAATYRRDHPEWTDAQRAAAMLHLAAHARASRDPQLGLSLLHGVDPQFWADESTLLLSADLHSQLVGRGVETDIGHAGAEAMAADGYAWLGLFELSGACLMQLSRRLDSPDPRQREAAAGWTLRNLAQVRSSRSPLLSRIVHDVTQRLAWYFMADQMHIGPPPVFHMVAKGADFANEKIDGETFILPSEVTRERPRTGRLIPSLLDDDYFGPPNLLNFSWRPGPSAAAEDGGQDGGTLRYPDHSRGSSHARRPEIEKLYLCRLDHLINVSLPEFRASGVFETIAVSDIMERLDDNMVLLSYFLPSSTADADTDVWALLFVTHESAEAIVLLDTREADPGTPLKPRPDVAAREVRDVITAVTGDPLFDVIGPDATELLRRTDRVFGPGILDRLRAKGKDHLCIWPHGPLHFMPFHLYMAGDEPIASHWTVTTIPSLDSLSVGQRWPRRPRRTLVVGYGGGLDQIGLLTDSPLEDVDPVLRQHAIEIAARAGTEALVGRAATRARLLAGLGNADVIHIAAHGSHEPDAPWFDCLYLCPDEEAGDDGRVFAYDFLATDLRGVRLITLAACESALGRFDLNDNLRGLPAGFLLAGAQAVVGCLWPVRPEPATMFFSHLHRVLAEGAEPLPAFRAAQLEARQLFPKFRDWGAFSFRAGDWAAIKR